MSSAPHHEALDQRIRKPLFTNPITNSHPYSALGRDPGACRIVKNVRYSYSPYDDYHGATDGP